VPNLQAAAGATRLEGDPGNDIHRPEVGVELAPVEDKNRTHQRATSCPIDSVRRANSSHVDR